MKRHTCVTRYRKQSTKGKTEANAAKIIMMMNQREEEKKEKKKEMMNR